MHVSVRSLEHTHAHSLTHTHPAGVTPRARRLSYLHCPDEEQAAEGAHASLLLGVCSCPVRMLCKCVVGLAHGHRFDSRVYFTLF